MAFKIALWFMALMFVAMIYNVTTAYTAMSSVSVQDKFEEIGLIEKRNGGFIIPAHKPPVPQEMLASAN